MFLRHNVLQEHQWKQTRKTCFYQYSNENRSTLSEDEVKESSASGTNNQNTIIKPKYTATMMYKVKKNVRKNAGITENNICASQDKDSCPLQHI